MSKLITHIASVAVLALFLFLLLVAVSRGQQATDLVSSGGSYILEKTVVAGGGRDMVQAQVSQHGTAGQTVAGVKSAAGQYSLYSGFWTPDLVVPTAAEVTISGSVRTVDGAGIRNAVLKLTAPDGSVRTVQSGSLGIYLFSGIMAGQTYVLTVSAKRFRFQQAVQVLQVGNDLGGIDFVSN